VKSDKKTTGISLEHRRRHTAAGIAERLAQTPETSYLRDFVYGAVDGAVTTFAIVAGVAGAQLSTVVVIVLGLSNLLADGFSMAASNFLGTRSEIQLREKARAEEREHIRIYPEGEREEIRQIFVRKGFSGQDLDRIVEVITADRERWINTMLREEHGMSLSSPKPWKAALATFAAFIVAGSVPLCVYLWNWASSYKVASPFLWCAVSTGATFLAIGIWRGRLVQRNALLAGGETLLLGGSAAALAYAVGVVLRPMMV
jgi:VIT1/CCC1 family predicted Fe2+/Mn2+ transporter